MTSLAAAGVVVVVEADDFLLEADDFELASDGPPGALHAALLLLPRK